MHGWRRPVQTVRLAACSRLARAMTRWNGVITARYVRPSRLWQCTTVTTTSSLLPAAPARCWIASRKSRWQSSAPISSSAERFDSRGKKPITSPRAAAAIPTARDDLTLTVAIIMSRTGVNARIHPASTSNPARASGLKNRRRETRADPVVRCCTRKGIAAGRIATVRSRSAGGLR